MCVCMCVCKCVCVCVCESEKGRERDSVYERGRKKSEFKNCFGAKENLHLELPDLPEIYLCVISFITEVS